VYVKKAMGEVHEPTTVDEFVDLVSCPQETWVYYTATWCGPCKRVSPELVASTKRRIQVDADRAEAIFVERRIQTIPHIEVWKEGKLLQSKSGQEQVLRFVQQDRS
jgi:thioredoxin 1